MDEGAHAAGSSSHFGYDAGGAGRNAGSAPNSVRSASPSCQCFPRREKAGGVGAAEDVGSHCDHFGQAAPCYLGSVGCSRTGRSGQRRVTEKLTLYRIRHGHLRTDGVRGTGLRAQGRVVG